MIKKVLLKIIGPSGYHVYNEFRNALATPVFSKQCIDYDKYWEEREFIAFQPRFPVIAGLIYKDCSILDVGCGDGGMLAYLKKERDGIKELGIDISKVAIEKCQSLSLNCKQVTLFEHALDCYTTNTRYNFVVMSEVIEHVVNPEAMVRVAWSLTRQRLIISFPNIAFWPHRLRMLCGRFPIQWVYFQAEHLRYWSLTDFIQWLHALELPAAHINSQVIATTGTTYFKLSKMYPNLFGNQIIVYLDRVS